MTIRRTLLLLTLAALTGCAAKPMTPQARLDSLLGDHGVDIGCYGGTLFHRIAGDETLGKLSVSSKMNAEWPFLCHLRDAGRRTAAEWLAENFTDLGHRATLDVESVYRDTEGLR
ncbi:MAG: hypothetical protein ACOCTI_07200 [Phycisphaeraceae bacterium]